MPVRARARRRSVRLVVAVEPVEARTMLSGTTAHSDLVKSPIPKWLRTEAHQPHSVVKLTAVGGSNAIHGLTAAQMRGAYGLGQYNVSSAGTVAPSIVFTGGVYGLGQGQTIDIIDAYDDTTALADLNAFSAAMGLPQTTGGQFTFAKVNQTGGSSLPGVDPEEAAGSGDTWEVEESLDIEWSHVMAPLANIVLVECTSASNTNLGAGQKWAAGQTTTGGSTSVASVASMSYGSTETSSETTSTTSGDPTFVPPATHAGVTFVASTGDSGSPGGYPAASPYVAAVGGTKLTVGANNTYGSEVGWNYSGGSGTGGGISSYEAQPTYQAAVVPSSVATPTGTKAVGGKRVIPDVSLDASTGVAIYDSGDFGAATPWYSVGGTSLSSPMFAGLVAVANQGRVAAGLPVFAGAATSGSSGTGTVTAYPQALTSLYSLPTTDFHDVTSGNNNAYAAAAGYDAVSGRGTPIASLLVPQLAFGTAVSLTGTNVYLKEDADGTQLDAWVNSATPGTGTPTVQYQNGTFTSLTVTGTAGNDTLTLDDSAGLFTAGLTSFAFAGGAGTNTVSVVGTASADTLTATATTLTTAGGLGTVPVTISNVSALTFASGGSAADTVNVDASDVVTIGSADVTLNVGGTGTAVTLPGTQTVAGLSVGAGDTVTLPTSAAAAGNALVVSALTVAPTGQLQLANNALVVRGGNLSAVTALVAAGYAGGAWTGVGGIASSAAAADATFRTALGVAQNADATGNPVVSAVAGVSLAATDVLVRYTYYGDATLDGKVDGADYARADAGYLSAGALTGWGNGDFNYDTAIDGSDYTLIDNAYNTQAGSL